MRNLDLNVAYKPNFAAGNLTLKMDVFNVFNRANFGLPVSNISAANVGVISKSDTDAIKLLTSGEIDVAIAWGPLAGYFAPRQSPRLVVTAVSPTSDGPDIPFVFDVAMAVAGLSARNSSSSGGDHPPSGPTMTSADQRRLPSLFMPPPSCHGTGVRSPCPAAR